MLYVTSFGRVNGLFVAGDRLLVGNTEDGTLRSIELATRRVSVLGCLGAGVVDGIRVAEGEGYLVSRWDGPTFLLSPAGELVEILDPHEKGWNVADFEYVSSERMIIAPTFSGDRVVAYELK